LPLLMPPYADDVADISRRHADTQSFSAYAITLERHAPHLPPIRLFSFRC